MSVLSYLFPQVVADYTSPYNKHIRILEEQGKYKLLVNGSRQSGEYVKKLWQHALASFGIIPSPDIRKILVLGVAGGNVIHILRALYPDAMIDGVDIDAKMIDIGKKYFGLDSIQRLHLFVSDAVLFVDHAAKKSETWDLILVDVHVGATVPPFVAEETYLKNVKKILSPRGKLIINYLREFEYQNLSDTLQAKLKKTFRTVRDAGVCFNRFFYCS